MSLTILSAMNIWQWGALILAVGALLTCLIAIALAIIYRLPIEIYKSRHTLKGDLIALPRQLWDLIKGVLIICLLVVSPVLIYLAIVGIIGFINLIPFSVVVVLAVIYFDHRLRKIEEASKKEDSY